MTLKKPTISVRLDADAKRRLEKAASLTQQSPTTFVEQAMDERAHEVLLDWAVRRYREGDTTFSLLAAETGLTVVDIMYAMGRDGGADEAAESFLTRARAVAEAQNDPDLLRLAQEVVAKTRSEPL